MIKDKLTRNIIQPRVHTSLGIGCKAFLEGRGSAEDCLWVFVIVNPELSC